MFITNHCVIKYIFGCKYGTIVYVFCFLEIIYTKEENYIKRSLLLFVNSMPRIHIANKPCTYEGCDRMFTTKQNLEAHMCTHTGARPYPCTWEGCDKAFTTSSSRASHLRIHTQDKRYLCDHEGCDYATVCASSLTCHKRIHNNVKPFKCQVDGCDYASEQSSNLHTHMLTHTQERKFKCLTCGATFNHKSSLMTHERTHSGEKPFVCDYDDCDAAFAQSHDLTIHKKRHQNIRDFPCTVPDCDKAFYTKEKLNNHIRTHTNERPYVCQIDGCDASFRRKHHLNLHNLLHVDSLPIICPHEDCDAAFRQGAHLKAHVHYYHTEKGQQERKLEESAVAKALDEAGLDYTGEHLVQFRCMADVEGRNARVDFVLIQNGVVILLEVDEYQHESYSMVCETSRMVKIHEALILGGNELPVVFLRFNPHAFKVDGKTKKTTKKTRYAKLIDSIKNLNAAKVPPFSTQYLYYNCNTVNNKLRPCVFDDEEYSNHLSSCCADVVV